MEPETEDKMAMSIPVSKSMAVVACVILTFLYVAILYAPTFILRLPPPTSYKQFLIRRFFCAAVSSVLSLLVSSALLPIWRLNILDVLAVYGVRAGHVWHTLAFPFLLTSLMYMGSLVKSILPFCQWNEGGREGTADSYIHTTFCKIYNLMMSYASDITAWRNLVVAPITEELVFRGCMIPLLLCGGFNSKTVVFICPIFFSLDILLQVPTIADFYKVFASRFPPLCSIVPGTVGILDDNSHLNHVLEFYIRKNCSLLKTSVAVGTQLAYTMVFGSYASFLFVRTGHLAAPLVAHTVCNFMGLPALYYSGRKGILVSLAFIGGCVGFVRLLFPLTEPSLYNTSTHHCRCWHGYCSWI